LMVYCIDTWCMPRRWALEAQLEYTPSYTGYSTVRLPSDSTFDGVEVIPYHRLTARLGASWAYSRRFHFTGFAGGGIGGPIMGDDGDRMNGNWFWDGRVAAQVRILSLDAWVEVVLGARLDDETTWFSDTSFQGDPVPQKLGYMSGVLAVHLRVGP
jgi:hypothetical protein